MFVVRNGLPYFIKGENDKMVYPCEIDAFSYRVDYTKGVPSPKDIKSIMTDSEIRAKFNIVPIDGWDSENNKLITVTNKKVSSIFQSETVSKK